MARVLIPNSTQVPDVILDHWMAELSGAEFKVLLYIARRTYGFGKDSDTISLSQISRGLIKRDGTTLDRGTGVSRMSVTRALKVLEERGIVLRQQNLSEKNREYEENTYRINLDWEPPPNTSRGGGGTGETHGGGSGGEVVSKCDHLATRRGARWYQNVTTVVTKCDLQETDIQETDQETASSKPGPQNDAANADAGDLVQMLISHGVGKSIAGRLVREKPEVCRQYLDFLPYAKFRTTKGAWLANAIRDEYGPPPGYENAIERKTGSRATDARKHARQSHKDAIAREKESKLRDAYHQMENVRGEAYTAFNEYLEMEQTKASRIADHLSPRQRENYLATFDDPARRFELFREWVSKRGGPAIHSLTPTPSG